ncbi:MAG TPA: acyl-CoA dehydrogenase family protein, partial [Acidimicrobiales bacterium]|nr:acyl-CoA dehydrogenase family protein [Acidimicrobiales bacterium]
TLGAVTSGSQIVTLALRPPDNGSVAMVPAGAVAHQALVLETDRLRIVTLTDANRRLVANLADAPIADVVIDESSELETGAGAAERFERAIDEWLVLCAGLLVGIASTAHRVTCAYARERHAWDTPIGSFQAVAHPLANGAVNIDGARLLTQKAAWELDRNGPRGRELVSTAFAFAAETARDVTYDAVHFHGGYGFTVESDLQLFYRRARGWARIWGEPAMGYQRAGDSRYLGEEGTGSRGL